MRLGPRRRGLLLCGCGLAAFALGAAACGRWREQDEQRHECQHGCEYHFRGGGRGHGLGRHRGRSAGRDRNGGHGRRVRVQARLVDQLVPPGHLHLPYGQQWARSSTLSRSWARAWMRRPPTSTPGQSADLQVTLQDGSYDLFCPIDSHKSLGMNQRSPSAPRPHRRQRRPERPATTVPASSSGGGVSY